MSNSNTNKLKREISVIIPNYNGKALLEKNIPSVIAAKYLYQNGFQLKSTLIFFVRNNPSNNNVATFSHNGANSLMDRKKLLEVKYKHFLYYYSNNN